MLGRAGVARGLAAWIVCGALACGADANEATRAETTRAETTRVETRRAETRRAETTDEAAAAPTPSAPPSAPRIGAVSISVQPADSGSAHCRYEPDGSVRGGHLSGGPSPFVHEAEGTISPEIRRAIVSAVEATLAEPRPSSGVTPGAGTERIEIELEDGARVVFAWPFGGAHDDSRVVALAALLREHRLGGW